MTHVSKKEMNMTHKYKMTWKKYTDGMLTNYYTKFTPTSEFKVWSWLKLNNKLKVES